MVPTSLPRALRLAELLGRALGTTALDLLAPSRCAGCATEVRSRVIFCPPCAVTLERAGGSAGEHAPFLYGGALAQAITSCKYGGRPELARALSHLLLTQIDDLRSQRFTVAVPVPLHPLRLVERGYNVPALLLGPVARALAIPHSTGQLRRVRPTAQQASLPRVARLENVRGAFVVRRAAHRPFGGARVLLLDDVYTTGATLGACAEALHEAGAAVVVTRALAVSDDA